MNKQTKPKPNKNKQATTTTKTATKIVILQTLGIFSEEENSSTVF